MKHITEDAVWTALQQVMDPEIPSLSVVDMGMIQEVRVDDQRVHVAMTPTFAGCPAIDMMQDAIRHEMTELGAAAIEVELRFDPPWTSNRITAEGRRKLKAFGLAPPLPYQGEFNIRLMDLVTCPYCESTRTRLETPFGPTLCRAIYYCDDCRQSFEQFKPV